ncbi:hypothetical protein GCM10023329_30580 [Streptomyces sanyensis]|uniref:Uncharacterized protein n=1 Tax=Streptomyces sanyensis TaxID=568869 RepID=A0ABP9AEQ3_9ACTN
MVHEFGDQHFKASLYRNVRLIPSPAYAAPALADLAASAKPGAVRGISDGSERALQSRVWVEHCDVPESTVSPVQKPGHNGGAKVAVAGTDNDNKVFTPPVDRSTVRCDRLCSEF